MTPNHTERRCVTVSPTASELESTNHLIASQDVAAELKFVTGQQITVVNQHPTPARRGTGQYVAAFTVVDVTEESTGTVHVSESGREYLSDTSPFEATVRNTVPDPSLSIDAARRKGECTETVTRASHESRILAIAPHAGAIEANTDESAVWFRNRLQQAGIPVDLYACHGFGKANFTRWHVSMSQLHLRSFPGLYRLAGNPYELVVAFHLHDVPNNDDSPKVLVGGRVDESLRTAVASRLDDALPSKYAFVTDHDAHSMMGVSGRNPVNWMSRDGASGLQLEVTPRISQIRRKTVGRRVADVVQEQYEAVIES